MTARCRFRFMPNLFDLSGRVAVVIGATSGLGRAIAIGLAEHGATVVPTGRRRSNWKACATRLDAAIRQTTDVTVAANRSTPCATRCSPDFGRIDILVNAAGYTFKQPTVEVTEEQWSDAVRHELERSVARLPVVLRAIESQRARAHHQHCLARFVPGVPRGGRLLRQQDRTAFADAQPGVRVGARRDFGECDHPRRVSHRDEQRAHQWDRRAARSC